MDDSEDIATRRLIDGQSCVCLGSGIVTTVMEPLEPKVCEKCYIARADAEAEIGRLRQALIHQIEQAERTIAKFIVLKFEGSENKRTWSEIQRFPGHNEDYWEAEDAGSAFHLAVLSNARERLSPTSYLVLPWSQGALFNVAINVDAQDNSYVEKL